ncbi:MAG: SIMPL domain-containing protein [Eubacteriales bacterium]
MKIRKLTFSLVLLLMVGLFTASCSAAGQIASDANDILQTKNTITVQGTASITVTPTIAYVNIGVATFNKEAAAAQSDNAGKMDQVYNALDGLGISKDKIKTVSYNISPRYDYSNNISTLAGYDVTNTIQVTVMDLTKVSQVLDMTVKQGVNQANSISFSITDQENDKIYLEALAQAVENAKGKAGALAAAAGVTLSDPLQITEGSQNNVTPIYSYASDSAKAGNAATPISGGELKVEATVTLVYKY